jgi:hypothetical protein
LIGPRVEKMRHREENPLIASLMSELETSLEVIAAVPEYIYQASERSAGSIGAHVRHNLDFVNALLRGVRTGMVDYTNRERDPRIENDRDYAGRRIQTAIDALDACAGVDPGSLLSVRSEVKGAVWHRSSFSRELEFVYSHTVHHHALIKERLCRSGIRMPADLGIAPSTRNYRDRLRLAA